MAVAMTSVAVSFAVAVATVAVAVAVEPRLPAGHALNTAAKSAAFGGGPETGTEAFGTASAMNYKRANHVTKNTHQLNTS